MMKNKSMVIFTALSVGVLASAGAVLPAVAQNSMAQEILNAHNRYRAEVGVPPLAWSPTLASHAQQWANQGRFQHSSGTGEGENLWMGTSRRFSPTQMVGSWGDEKRSFVRGTFPNVSSTGNWANVGHYTQVIWRNTTQVGCGGVDVGGNYIFVCRYSSPGNVMGQPVF
jgi:hypothetical protein